MSNPTLDKTKWQEVSLAYLNIGGWGKEYVVNVRGYKGCCHNERRVFATGAEVADFVKECLCGDTQDEGGGE